MRRVHSVSLYFTEGASDKVYKVDLLEDSNGGYWVNGWNGRRGAALTQRPQGDQPMTREKAQAVFDKLVASKKKGGYTEDESGAVYTSTEFVGRASGWTPQLLTALGPAGDEHDTKLTSDDAWWMQEKHNGERRAVEKLADGTLQGMNKKGLIVPVPAAWGDVLYRLPVGTILDGEQVGDELFVFDAVTEGGRPLVDLKDKPFFMRYEIARMLLERCGVTAANGAQAGIYLSPVAKTEQEKTSMRQRIERGNGEGWVFKNSNATYESGRASAKESVAVKVKLQESASFIVRSRHPTQRTVSLGLLDAEGVMQDLGSVTIPSNHDVPNAGSIVEIRFAYRWHQGALDQPVYLGARSDVTPAECVESQILRVRGGRDEDDASEMVYRDRVRG